MSQTLSSLALAAAASGRQAISSVLDHVSRYTSTIFQLHPARYILGSGTLGNLYVAADSIGGIRHVAQQYRNTGAAGESSGFVEGARWTRPVPGWMSSLGGSLVAGLMTLGRAAGPVVKRRMMGGRERERSNGTVGTVGKGDGHPGRNEADTEETQVPEGQLVHNGVLTKYGKQVCNSAPDPDSGGSDMSADASASGAGAGALIKWVKQSLSDGHASRPATPKYIPSGAAHDIASMSSNSKSHSENDHPPGSTQISTYSGFGHTPTDFGERQSAWQSTVDAIRRNPRTSMRSGVWRGRGCYWVLLVLFMGVQSACLVGIECLYCQR